MQCPAAAIRRFKLRRRLTFLSIVAIVVGLIIADRNGWLLVRKSDDMAAYHGVKTTVSRVIDGDTFEVHIPDSLNGKPVTRVRLWGVNCPELARTGRGRSGEGGESRTAQPWAPEAAQFTQSHLAEATVIIWLESHQTRDAFSVILAHVEFPDGRKLNEMLLSAGLGRVEERWPHTMLVRYAQLESAAKRKGVGVWSEGGGEDAAR